MYGYKFNGYRNRYRVSAVHAVDWLVFFHKDYEQHRFHGSRKKTGAVLNGGNSGSNGDWRRKFSRCCSEWYVRLWSERILVYYHHGYRVHHFKLYRAEVPCCNVKTVPEYFRRRYGKECGLITAIIMLLPLVGLTAGQFIASAVILSTMLNIDYQVAVIIVAVVVTVYSIMGGLWSVTLTDFVQVFLIVIGMIIAVPFAMNYAGGWSSISANIPEGTMNLFEGYDLFGIISLVIMYTATFSVGQEAVSRFYAAKDEKAAKGGAWLAALVNFIYAFIPTILGIITLALINMGKFSSEQFASVGARYALPVLAINTMPALICGLLFAGIISATMSSSDSDLLGAGSIFANDIYKAVLKPDASSDSVMKVTKIVMCLVGVASMLIALFNTQSIVSILMFCFTLRAAGSFFPYVMGHYWKKASTAGTIASLLAGTIVVVYLEHVSKGVLFGIKFSQPIIPGLVAAFIGFVVFSKLMPPKVETTELAPEEDD